MYNTEYVIEPESPPTRFVTVIRLLLVGIGIPAAVLGWLGFRNFLHHLTPPDHDFWDIPYNTAQLYLLGSNALQMQAGPYPLQLEFARFLAPASTLIAVIEAARVLLGAEIRRFRSRMSRQHAVVVGDTAFARNLAAQLTASRHRVVVVRGQAAGLVELRRTLGVVGDATSREVLRGAGVRRARYLYVCGEDDQTNHAVAVAASLEVSHREQPPWIYVQLNRPDICHSLQARRLSAASSNRFRLDYFHVDDIAARVLHLDHPVKPARGRPVRILIAGDSSFRRVLLLETARFWRVEPGATRDGIHVDVVGAGAVREVAMLADRFPFFAASCGFATFEEDFSPWLGRNARPGHYDRVYLCFRDEQYTLEMALNQPRLWRTATRKGKVFVTTYRNAALAEAFHGEPQNDLLDEVNQRLEFYPVTARACNADLISDDLTERLAKQIHQRYREAYPSSSHGPWEELGESIRNANRAQVQGIAEKIQRLQRVIAVRGEGPESPISAEDLEDLAELEHRRWCDERIARKWRYAPVRSDRRRTHPDLVPWKNLDRGSRDKARAAIAWMPEVLADEGFAIIQLDGE